MSNVYTGMVQGVSKIDTGTPLAFCRAVTGGTFSRDSHSVRKRGVGGQLHKRKGTDEVGLEITCIGVELADLQLFCPTTAGVVVAGFPDMLVEVDDGANGQEWVLTSGQPVSIRASISDSEDAEVEYTLGMRFQYAVEAAAGTAAPVYNSLLGHTINDIMVQIAGASQGVLSFDLRNDLGTKMINPMDAMKATNEKTRPASYAIRYQDPVFACVTSEVFKGSAMDADLWSGEDIVVTMKNGTDAQDLIWTLSSFSPTTWNMPFDAEDVTGFAHEFTPQDGVQYNRVALAAS